MTPAGKTLLTKYLDEERRGALKTVGCGHGQFVHGVSLAVGDGAQLAAARKLVRDGLATMTGGSRNANRCLSITEAGRAAMSRETETF